MPIYRLSATAEADIIQLLAYTQDRFGETARRRYEALLVAALRDIASNPERLGSVARPEFGPAVRSYHLRHSRRRARTPDGLVRQPRHFLLYRMTRPDLIGIGRVLYDGMEVERHLPSQYGDE
ncbi:MAG TPA: type II toxin-antitoxin system RelE/ParE family toxin [Acetobacteraceae bacterium]|nr:type II toxin-antitoxin system RelE/ParE family toxin [Acetobacteraceae bacterium]